VTRELTTAGRAQYQAARWSRIYWCLAVLISALGGAAFIAGAVASHGAGSIAFAVIGAVWLTLALFALHTSRRLAWTVNVAATGVTLTGPRLRLTIPPADVVEVRATPGDVVRRGSHELLTANHGLVRLGPSRHVGDFLAALRQVNPTVRLPSDDPS
jgi:hypothetical protein